MEIIALFGSALLMGLITGFHCIGMCGPIALSLGLGAGSWKFHLKNLSYQFGRITTYSLMGVVLGLLGTGFSLLGIQSYISIAAGILLIVSLFFPVVIKSVERYFSPVQKLMVFVKVRLGGKLQSPTTSSKYITGVLNGLLPCGPVYIALTAALAIGGWWQSGLYMFFFGLGTLPMMFSIVVAGSLMSVSLRNKLYKVYPFVIALVGCIFILRGLHLGIPFLSPPEEALKVEAKKRCCE